MNDDRSLDRAARSWLEEGPTRAPDRSVEAALVRINTTRQERDLVPWRLPTMNPILRWAAVAVVAAVGLGAAVLVFGPGRPFGPGADPTPSPIATGAYALDLPVAGILARVDRATNLTASERLAIKRDILGIEGATTLNLRISITADSFDLRYGTDAGPLLPGVPWTISANDGREIAFTNIPSGANTARYAVIRSADGRGFRLRALTPTSGVETLVREILFDTADYVPVP
jgi:hypothetical protein